MSIEPIYVTKPLLPELEKFIPYLEQIWDSKQLTNGGSMHRQLERQLAEYLGVEHVALFNNGTIALLTALQALCITGEVITTPYSFIATAHSLLWNGIRPVFADIDPHSFNLDPEKIEAAITPHTTAIMPVHCYGNPCETEAIQRIADNYNLKIIYDAAHSFGVRDTEGSILRHGDLSVLSFHATKVFNTFEGGAIICPDAKTKRRIDQLKNFGFVNETTVVCKGINGKMSEINAALGLLQLEYIDKALLRRKHIALHYNQLLGAIKGISIPDFLMGQVANNSYYPILVEEDYPISRDELFQRLRVAGVYSRRCFYPIISEFPMYRDFNSAKKENLANSYEISRKVICLPIYPELSKSEQLVIASLI